MLDMIDKDDRTATLIEQLRRTKNNKEFLATLKVGLSHSLPDVWTEEIVATSSLPYF